MICSTLRAFESDFAVPDFWACGVSLFPKKASQRHRSVRLATAHRPQGGGISNLCGFRHRGCDPSHCHAAEPTGSKGSFWRLWPAPLTPSSFEIESVDRKETDMKGSRFSEEQIIGGAA
jgi:hypothetical protein